MNRPRIFTTQYLSLSLRNIFQSILKSLEHGLRYNGEDVTTLADKSFFILFKILTISDCV